MIGYESIQVYATSSGFPSGASHSHNIIYYSPPPPCQQAPLKKGNSQMKSSVQNNPAAPLPVRLVSSRAMSTSTGISGYFQLGQANVVLGPTPLRLYHLSPDTATTTLSTASMNINNYLPRPHPLSLLSSGKISRISYHTLTLIGMTKDERTLLFSKG